MATSRDGEGRKVVGVFGRGGGEEEDGKVGKKMPDTAKSTNASAKADTAAGRSLQAGTEGDGAGAGAGADAIFLYLCSGRDSGFVFAACAAFHTNIQNTSYYDSDPPQHTSAQHS